MSDAPRSGIRIRLPLDQAVVPVSTPHGTYIDEPTVPARDEEPSSEAVSAPDGTGSSPKSPTSPKPGVPEAIFAARLRYAGWNEELSRKGLSRGEADAVILARAEALGGVALPEETINLTFWSQKTRIPRPILEALVLSTLRDAQDAGTEQERGQVDPRDIEAISSDSGPWTPPPPSFRSARAPHSQPPSGRHL